MPAIVNEAAATGVGREPAPERVESWYCDLYRERLRRLLAVQPSSSPELSYQEQGCLRSRAVFSTVRTLTSLGRGEVASELLRQARPDEAIPAS
jgi:hypothetical protein